MKEKRSTGVQCISLVSRAIASSRTVEELLGRVVEQIPIGWDGLDGTSGGVGATIRFDGEVYGRAEIDETGWRRSSDIVIHGEPCGSVEVSRPAAQPDRDGEPVDPDEGDLLDSIGCLVGQGIERVRLEEQFEERGEKLKSLGEEIKKFAFIVSHDLRAPLVNIKGFSTELSMAMEVVLPFLMDALPKIEDDRKEDVLLAVQEDIPEAVEFIESSVTRMDVLIGAILKLSRLEHYELSCETIDMEALVRETVENLSALIREHGAEVTVGTLPPVEADRKAMDIVVENLLDNAVKYLEPGRAGQIEITSDQGSDVTTFRVSDNGRGIAEKDVKTIFSLFRRAGVQDVPGEGMGLTYAHSLLRRNGGDIRCESEAGAGSTFVFTLPNKR